MQISTIGLDIAKNVFQVHRIDAAEKVVVRKRLRRRQLLQFFTALPPCLVGMEACATAHYWARELTKLGHEVKLIAAQFVRPFVKTNKNDAADAQAIWTAAQQPEMRFVAIKTPEQQAILALHAIRQRLMKKSHGLRQSAARADGRVRRVLATRLAGDAAAGSGCARGRGIADPGSVTH